MQTQGGNTDLLWSFTRQIVILLFGHQVRGAEVTKGDTPPDLAKIDLKGQTDTQ